MPQTLFGELSQEEASSIFNKMLQETGFLLPEQQGQAQPKRRQKEALKRWKAFCAQLLKDLEGTPANKLAASYFISQISLLNQNSHDFKSKLASLKHLELSQEASNAARYLEEYLDMEEEAEWHAFLANSPPHIMEDFEPPIIEDEVKDDWRYTKFGREKREEFQERRKLERKAKNQVIEEINAIFNQLLARNSYVMSLYPRESGKKDLENCIWDFHINLLLEVEKHNMEHPLQLAKTLENLNQQEHTFLPENLNLFHKRLQRQALYSKARIAGAVLATALATAGMIFLLINLFSILPLFVLSIPASIWILVALIAACDGMYQHEEPIFTTQTSGEKLHGFFQPSALKHAREAASEEIQEVKENEGEENLIHDSNLQTSLVF